jgi:hypothetical protein
MVLVPPPRWEYRPTALPPPGGRGAGKAPGPRDQVAVGRAALRAELERQRAPLLAEERERLLNLEVAQLRLEALRQAVEEEKPAGMEADRARERLHVLEELTERLRDQDREKRAYLRLLERRLRALREEEAPDEAAGPRREWLVSLRGLERQLREGDEDQTSRAVEAAVLEARLAMLRSLSPDHPGRAEAIKRAEKRLEQLGAARKRWAVLRQQLRKSIEEVRRLLE